MSETLLELRDLSVQFRKRRRDPTTRAVDGVDLVVPSGATVGLVGESGSGKSTIARAVLGLTPVHGGQIRFDGRDITRLGARDRRGLSSDLQAVFQDPNSSLNPSYTVGRSLAEPMTVHAVPPEDRRRRVVEMLDKVGLPAEAAARYPAEFSGGQRQRIAIARALMTSPRLVICDEAVSALDLSVQAQVLNLLQQLQRDEHLSYLFISHDLTVVRHLCQGVVVLYRGQVMESGPSLAVTSAPAHPYTRALLAAAPLPDPRHQRARHDVAFTAAAPLDGDKTDSMGCPFAPRCPYTQQRCRVERPRPTPTPEGGAVACHRYPEWRSL
jgi:oligopeptide/dipeptide ABC transporter ATP-binding protein